MSHGEMYWIAYQYGHNLHGLRGNELHAYSCAYADVFEPVAALIVHPATLEIFWHDWREGQYEPDDMGVYHHVA